MISKPSKIQPALVGGLILGLLSSIPFVNMGNICCCLWVLLGGAIAAKILISKSPYTPVTMGEGAATGAIAGVFGCIITLFLGIPLQLLTTGLTSGFYKGMMESVADPEVRRAMEQAMAQQRTGDIGAQILGALFSWFIGSIIFIGFATLGGLIGVSIFEKRKGQTGYIPPTPPGAAPY